MNRLEEIKENQELAKKADDDGDWDAYGRYCTYQDHKWLIDRVEKLTEALKPIFDKHNNHTLCRCEWDEEGYQLANDPECIHNKAHKAVEEE